MTGNQRPDHICQPCWNGDHSSHDPSLGGICVGCLCTQAAR